MVEQTTRAGRLCVVVLLLVAAGCGDRPAPGGSDDAAPGTGDDALLADIELARPEPEELGAGWAYALGRKGPGEGSRTINEGYENHQTGAYVKLVISKQRSVAAAVAFFERQTNGFRSPPHAGLGEQARIEPRGSRRRPYFIVCFRRANIVVTLHQSGREPQAALHVARTIDNKIKENL